MEDAEHRLFVIKSGGVIKTVVPLKRMVNSCLMWPETNPTNPQLHPFYKHTGNTVGTRETDVGQRADAAETGLSTTLGRGNTFPPAKIAA